MNIPSPQTNNWKWTLIHKIISTAFTITWITIWCLPDSVDYRLSTIQARPLKVNIFVVTFTQTFSNVNREKLWTTKKEEEIKRNWRSVADAESWMNHSFVLLHRSDLWVWCLFNFEMLFSCGWEGRRWTVVRIKSDNLMKNFNGNDEILVSWFTSHLSEKFIIHIFIKQLIEIVMGEIYFGDQVWYETASGS